MKHAYDGIIYYFEEEIKNDERVSRILAHFDRRQLLRETRDIKTQYAGMQQELTVMRQQIAQYNQNSQYGQAAETAQQAAALEQQRQEYKQAYDVARQNAVAWKHVDAELSAVRQQFGLISRELNEHFDELQQWLSTELEEVKNDLKAHISAESQENLRSVERLLIGYLGESAAVTVQQDDFRIKSFRLWDRYERVEKLGEGGFSQVWKVQKGGLTPKALKVLHAHLRGNRAHVNRFLAEGTTMGALGAMPGRFFAAVHDMGQTAGGEYFLEMDCLDGQTLHHLLCQRGAFELDMRREPGASQPDHAGILDGGANVGNGKSRHVGGLFAGRQRLLGFAVGGNND